MVKTIVAFLKRLFRIKTKTVQERVRKKRTERRLDFVQRSARLEGLE